MRFLPLFHLPEMDDVVSYPCGPVDDSEVKQLRCGLAGSLGEDNRLAVSEIRERDAKTNLILSRWDVYSLSKVEVDASDDPATIHLTFQTMRKDAQRRSYVMDAGHCWVLFPVLHSQECSDLRFWMFISIIKLKFRCMF